MIEETRAFSSEKFKDGLVLLLRCLPGFSQALSIKDLRRTPGTPAALVKLLAHLHTNKHLPAGLGYFTLSSTLLVIELKNYTRITIEFSREGSRKRTFFYYRYPQPLKEELELPGRRRPSAPGVVSSEGLFIP